MGQGGRRIQERLGLLDKATPRQLPDTHRTLEQAQLLAPTIDLLQFTIGIVHPQAEVLGPVPQMGYQTEQHTLGIG